MNINKINRRWPMSCRDSVAMLDRMNTCDAYECGLITKAECDAIIDAFICEISIALETKGYVSAEDVHITPKSEIVKQFRKGAGQAKANYGCEKDIFINHSPLLSLRPPPRHSRDSHSMNA